MITRQQEQPPQQTSYSNSVFLLVLLALVCLLFWPGVVAGLALYRQVLRRWPRWFTWAGLGVGGALTLGIWWLLLQPFQQLSSAAGGLSTHSVGQNALALLPFWGGTLLLAPAVALAIALLWPRSAANRVREQSAQEELKRTRAAAAARQNMTTGVPDQIGDHGVLGRVIDTDHPAETRLHWGDDGKGWMVLPGEILNKHGVVIGGSGTGKTRTLLRIAYIALKYGWSVHFLDAKGDQDTAALFLAMAREVGTKRVAIFPASAYNGWRGDHTAILNRLMVVQDYSEAYYQAVAKRILHIVCTEMGPEPPRSSRDLFSRFEELGENLQAYRLSNLKPDTLAGAELRYQAFFASLAGKLDGNIIAGGWSFDDVDSSYILLDGLALKEEAASLGRFLLEDFAHFAAKRKPLAQPTLLIIDEFSAISPGGADAANLFERLRSYNAAIIASAQSYAGLGTGAERILDAALWLIVHGTPSPEQLIRRAGERLDVAIARQVANLDQSVGRGMMYVERRAAIDANEPRRLGTGEALIISRGQYRHLQVAPVKIDDLNLSLAQWDIADMSSLPSPSLDLGEEATPAPEDV